jgi:TRAF3-interacting protein 1
LNENFEIKTTNICNRNNLCFKFTLVKGDEPEKTNFFLQAFHRAATSGKDFNKFISKYLEHKKKKAEEKKKATSDQKEEVKKEEPKKEPEKIKAPAEKPAVKETSKPSQPSQPSQPVQNTNNNQSNASTSKVSIARPQTPGKRPDKVTSEAKELKEEPKIAGKAPQGLISDKIKNQEEENKENNSNAAKSNNTSNSVKPKIKDDDLAPSSTGGKIKITSKIGKFTDLTAGDDTTKTVTKTFTQADLESIKNYVQDISKNSNPIGKIIDFLQDDIDSMNKELQGWIKESKTYKERFDEEVK